jgi:hypothetical protein
MNLNKKLLAAALIFGVMSQIGARDLCNREGMAKDISACLSISTPSDYQKGGLDDLLKGRFCGKGDLARDGLFRCLGDSPDAIKNILGCSPPAVLELAVGIIPENDPRKPASCN